MDAASEAYERLLDDMCITLVTSKSIKKNKYIKSCVCRPNNFRNARICIERAREKTKIRAKKKFLLKLFIRKQKKKKKKSYLRPSFQTISEKDLFFHIPTLFA